MSMNYCQVFAASASVWPQRVWFSEPYLRVTMDEAHAPRAGAYVDHNGRLCRVVRVERPKDWFETSVTVVMTNGPIEDARLRSSWNEAQFMTLLRRLPSVGPVRKAVEWLEDKWLA